jgi:hypothetical protein
MKLEFDLSDSLVKLLPRQRPPEAHSARNPDCSVPIENHAPSRVCRPARVDVRYDLPIVFQTTPELATRQIESWSFWYARKTTETVNDLWHCRNVREAL